MAAVTQQCGIPGNSDLYGLGIRVGVYLQWFTSYIAVYFCLEDSKDLHDTYIIFSAALEIAVFLLTFQHATYTIEIVIVFYLVFGGILSVNSVSWKENVADLQKNSQGIRFMLQFEISQTPLREILQYSTSLAMAIYGSWFWINGRSSQRFLATPCGNIVFLFGRIPARHFGRASIFFAALMLCLAVYHVVGLGVVLWNKLILKNIRNSAAINSSVEFEAIDQKHKSDIIMKINDEEEKVLGFILQTLCRLSPESALSANLEDFDLDHISISANNGTTRHIIPVQPSMKSYNELQKRLKNMMVEQIFIAGDKNPVGADPNITSVSERLQATYRHLKSALKSIRFSFDSSANDVIEKVVAFQTLVELAKDTFNAFIPIYAILAIELTLRWNRISGLHIINSTGQLIPFIMSMVGFLKVCYGIHRQFKQRREDKLKKPVDVLGERGAPLIDSPRSDPVVPETYHNDTIQSTDSRLV